MARMLGHIASCRPPCVGPCCGDPSRNPATLRLMRRSVRARERRELAAEFTAWADESAALAEETFAAQAEAVRSG